MTSTEPLPGGNSGPVIRVGDTVRRVAGPWTAQVQALMLGLREAGVSIVPEPLGLDPEGREVVEYVEGDVGIYPMPDWVWNDELLTDVGRAMRQIHDAGVGLDLPLTGWRREAVEPVEVICHVDVAPYNAVCRDSRLVALIDWDYAAPGPRGWDLGYAAYRWVSLTPPRPQDGRTAEIPEQRRRLQLLCDAYGTGITPDEVIGWAIARLDDLVAYSRQQELAGNETFIRTAAEGHRALYESDVAWLRREWRP